MNISIKQFRAFLALCKYKNFTRAAESVFLSQPAFSNLIYSLEKEVGLSLFYRDTKSVQLSVDGEVFYQIAQNMMNTFNQSIEALKEYTSKQQRKISIVTLPSIAAQWLPNMMEKFQLSYPDVYFEIKDMPSDHCISLVKEGIVDIGICGSTSNLTNIEATKIFSDSYYLVCHKNHPLANKENITLEDIKRSKIIRFVNTTSIFQSLHKDLFSDHSKDNYIEIEQLSTLFGLLLSNSGITLLPELTLYLFQHNDIIIKPILWDNLKRQIYLIRNKDRISTQSSNIFNEFLLNELHIDCFTDKL